MVDDLSYLEKSGRMGKATAMIGSFLNLKPIFSIEGGETSVKGSPRGGVAFDKMVELTGEAIPFGSDIKLGIAHAMSPDKIETIKSKLKDIEILEEALSLDNEKKKRLIKLLEEMEKHST